MTMRHFCTKFIGDISWGFSKLTCIIRNSWWTHIQNTRKDVSTHNKSIFHSWIVELTPYEVTLLFTSTKSCTIHRIKDNCLHFPNDTRETTFGRSLIGPNFHESSILLELRISWNNIVIGPLSFSTKSLQN